jgi:ATP-dependent protease ClpP protease subunit
MKQIHISGVIGWDESARPADLRAALKAAAGDDVEIVVSSPGGYVSDGIEMFNLIRNYPGHTTARLSGYAMSMASYIPLAANKVLAEDNAIYMIHNARGIAWGDHIEIGKYGETLKGMSRLLARAYVKRTGKSDKEIEQMMDAETYFFGQDMVEHGFVDEIIATGEETDRDSSVAVAFSAYQACRATMQTNQDATASDLQRAAAIFSATGNHPEKRKEMIMTLEQLRANHPDLVTAIAAEAATGMITAEAHTSAVAAARLEGAACEQQRIDAVRGQSIPGHEALIETLAFDGQSTAADAALAIVAAEKTQRTAAAADLETGSNAPVPPGGEEQGKTIKRTAFNALGQTEKRAFFAAGGKLVD